MGSSPQNEKYVIIYSLTPHKRRCFEILSLHAIKVNCFVCVNDNVLGKLYALNKLQEVVI